MAGVQEKEPLTVAQAKERLRAVSQRIDFLAPVRRHPVRSAGLALLAGFTWDRLLGGRTKAARLAASPGVLPLVLQLAMLLIKWGIKVTPVRNARRAD